MKSLSEIIRSIIKGNGPKSEPEHKVLMLGMEDYPAKRGEVKAAYTVYEVGEPQFARTFVSFATGDEYLESTLVGTEDIPFLQYFEDTRDHFVNMGVSNDKITYQNIIHVTQPVVNPLSYTSEKDYDTLLSGIDKFICEEYNVSGPDDGEKIHTDMIAEGSRIWELDNGVIVWAEKPQIGEKVQFNMNFYGSERVSKLDLINIANNICEYVASRDFVESYKASNPLTKFRIELGELEKMTGSAEQV